ncbi:hypothetical protein [Trinickia dinghuensis]|uniref:hypothetical protein n=1 Tax=Trinickia dinghuensis TaxID=2291023 RepID=UPI0015F18CCA|nr:hypothetical protein [Trinickia dinghuensis]
MTNSMRPRGSVTGISDANVGAGRIVVSTVVVLVHAGSPPPPRQAVVGIAAPPVARA